MAQLLSDGVPPVKTPDKGLSDIVYIWDYNRQRIKVGDGLPKWPYDPSLDRPRDIYSEADAMMKACPSIEVIKSQAMATSGPVMSTASKILSYSDTMLIRALTST